MPDEGITILDHLNGITVPGDVFKQPVNEYWALTYLWQGMEFLYGQARKCDAAALQALGPLANGTFVGTGSLPFFDSIPRGLLTCSFHWYAMSAYQYALIVGAIGYRQDKSLPIPPHYVRQVMPDILAFRDKVAAHFAWAKNHSQDNDAERLASILPTLGFDGSFHMPHFTVGMTRAGNHSTSEALVPWSICRVHEKLRERYWPAIMQTRVANADDLPDADSPSQRSDDSEGETSFLGEPRL